jgi:hypothetical protein
MSFLGAITGFANVIGSKFTVVSNSVLDSGGGGINYYPGNVAGSQGSGGQYVS